MQRVVLRAKIDRASVADSARRAREEVTLS
jgi:hypothetical protein